MNDKIVTHADLSMLRDMKARLIPEMDGERDLLDRLIAAAEADAPPLPEGWVLYANHDGSHRVLWHARGGLFMHDDCCGPFGSADIPRDRLTPLRPTITKAQLHDLWLVVDGKAGYLDRSDLQAALKVAGIEVSA